jgi:hypothetical protein
MRLFLVLLLGAAGALAGLPVRVGVIQLGAPEAPRLIAEEIAKLDGIEVVRETLQLKEGRKETDLTNEERQALGRQWQVQLLILVDANGDAFAYVDADTGEELFRIREKTPVELASSAFLLVEELRDTVRAEAARTPR